MELSVRICIYIEYLQKRYQIVFGFSEKFLEFSVILLYAVSFAVGSLV